MNTDWDAINRITETIIGRSYRVGNGLGYGFMEKCYENALAHELRKVGSRVEQQVPLKVWYDGVVVGEYVADLIVEECVIVEAKSIEKLAPIHSAQCINYLKATGYPVCLLINFAQRVEVKRFVGPGFQSGLNDDPSVSISAPSVAKPLPEIE